MTNLKNHAETVGQQCGAIVISCAIIAVESLAVVIPMIEAFQKGWGESKPVRKSMGKTLSNAFERYESLFQSEQDKKKQRKRKPQPVAKAAEKKGRYC